ncbi:MAG: M15 family metallopeptidase, partial [Lachnospira sp.]|nr:M15 family metallopeptidase [Lachnospira sp.]
MNNTHRRMMSRKRREAIKRRRIAVGSIAVVLIIIIIAVILSVKGCSSRNKNSNNDAINSNDTASSDINNANSVNEADSSGSSQDASKSGQTGTSSDNSDSSSGKTIGVSSNGYSIIEKDGVTYVGGVLIANKSYSLPKTFIPQDPDQPVNADRSSSCLDKTLMSAWRTMQKDATAQGLNIYIASGYRSYNYQVNVYNRYVSSDGKAAADTYSSRPGYSEHQTGLCFDLNSIEDSFQYTNEGKWVNDN